MNHYTDMNTAGYSADELAALNAELDARLASIDEDDTDTRNAAIKAHSDEVATR